MTDAPIVDRVVRRHLLRQAGWLNSVNGHFFTLLWDRSKWQIEEMADGSAIPSMRSLTEESNHVAYQMPLLDKALASKMGPGFSLSADTVRSYAKLHGDDKGPVARQKLIDAHTTIFDTMVKEMTADGRHEEVAKLEKIIPELRRKLVWKKVR